jgi:DNA-binding NarL/FixJ family response regulator
VRIPSTGQLVGDRKANTEIAAELFLSQKTVEMHMRNSFNKLGVAHRAAVARAVEQADRVRSSVTGGLT